MRFCKTGTILGTAVVCSVLLAGCGEKFPTLTQEEYDLIVNYSAGVLSKYNSQNGDKLTRLIPDPVEETAAGEEMPPEQPAAPEKSAQSAPAKPSEEAPVEETPIVPASQEDTGEEPGVIIPSEEEGTQASEDNTEESGGAAEETAQAAAVENAVDIGGNDLLQKMQSGIAVDFNGYYVLNSYPDNATGGTVLTAEPGCRLLILSFSLRNETGNSVDVNLLSSNPTFTLILNGQPVSKNLVTVLDNDFSTYIGTIPGGNSAGAVLCFQIREGQAKSIDTLNLKINYRGEEQVLRIE
ncbi:MAG: hypothetical protein K6G16_00750 [Lachnospiraceae bacterium]|nr:hypothetical protein [Lachnospiraceae bacterium]